MVEVEVERVPESGGKEKTLSVVKGGRAAQQASDIIFQSGDLVAFFCHYRGTEARKE